MFSDGLDSHALRWVQEGHPAISNANSKCGMNTDQDFKSSGNALGMPPPENFHTGHLPSGFIPVSRYVPLGGESDIGSDMDESSDIEEIHSTRFPMETSLPQNEFLKNTVPSRALAPNAFYRCTSFGHQQHYYSSDGYSGYSSSRDTFQQKTSYPIKPIPLRSRDSNELEEHSSDSGDSVGFMGQEDRSICGIGMPQRKSYAAENACYREKASSKINKTNLALQMNSKMQGSNSSGSINEDVFSNSEKDLGSNLPTAPPFDSCEKENVQATMNLPSLTAYGSSFLKGRDGSSAKKTISNAHSKTKIHDKYSRSVPCGLKAAGKSGSLPIRVPKFSASSQGPWHSVLAYDACVRLCLHSWARGYTEATTFLDNECALLREAFGLQQILLQSEEELLEKQPSDPTNERVIAKPKKVIGKVKIQVRKVRMAPYMPTGCVVSSLNLSMVKVQFLRYLIFSLHSTISREWKSLRYECLLPCSSSKSSIRHNSDCLHTTSQYVKEDSPLNKVGVRGNSLHDKDDGAYTCLLKIKSLIEDEAVRIHPSSRETHILFPHSTSDDLSVDVYDSKGKLCGSVLIRVESIANDLSEKTRWWPIYLEPEHELVGQMQVCMSYTSSLDDNNALKCGSVAETVAYDIVLEVAMKAQHFQQRNLVLQGSWKWLLKEFALYFGVSDAYTKLRYLSYVMDVATPTEDCLSLVHDLLLPVIMQSCNKNALSHQENRILGEMRECIEQVLSLVFENYKSLDESSLSGVAENFGLPNGDPAPALASAVKLYTLIHDILSPEARLKLCSYFEVAVKKRSKRHILDADDIFTSNTEGTLLDVSVSRAYQKMKALCYSMIKEINTDMEIHSRNILPSFIDLPNISASIYSKDLCTRLRVFLLACPPAGPSPLVADLLIATADFQKDLAHWSICPVIGGVDAKELFHSYIISWIQDKRLALLESCKINKVKWSGVQTQHLTTPFVDEIYESLKETLNEYEVIMCRWPEYIYALENAIADVEKEMVEALERQYADVLMSLKDSMTPKKFGLKYVQKLAKRKQVCPYYVPDEMGILLNTLKRLLDVLGPRLDQQLKSWASCIPDAGNNTVAGERLNEVAVTLRSKFRNYLQAVVEKLAENTSAQNSTNLKKIIQESRDVVTESDIRKRMQRLRDHLIEAITHLHKVFEINVFVSLCRGLWDRMGQDVLKFLENHKNRSWYKASRATIAVLDDTFASQMEQLVGNTLQEKDLEPPRSIMEVRSILCKDVIRDTRFNY
ncbi:hypothetical protein AXF42_Ash006625 [Apostasia shenzhenica]|uniref:Uncharacterized protein n=1 Tax=Apostasia shenzhenica TaxID=1088818 RepID=A0A2I0AIN8_9ASPA|nr:hypothetical protein AXF42_Ash006625 [Apostasia shenzhenica]